MATERKYKVKMIKRASFPDGPMAPGKEYEVTEKLARALIADDAAEAIDKLPELKKEDPKDDKPTT